MNNLIDQLFRDAIGYDTLKKFGVNVPDSKYPPHNIVKFDDERYELSLAVAGFAREELRVTVEDGYLTITGARTRSQYSESCAVLYQGLAFRDFARAWKLGEYVEVTNVTLVDGVLTVVMEQQIPEAKKVRTIAIQ